jgi:hypothetical protein
MSTAKFDTLSTLDGSRTIPVSTVAQGTARAWVNFNGTGTVAIRASFNVSSITDNGTGQYTVNFTTAMPDANYAISATSRNTSVGAVVAEAPGTSITTASFNMFTFRTNTTSGTDADYVSVAVFD